MNINLRDWIAFIRDRRGVTALEYAIIAGVLGAGLVTIFGTFKGALSTAMGSITF